MRERERRSKSGGNEVIAQKNKHAYWGENEKEIAKEELHVICMKQSETSKGISVIKCRLKLTLEWKIVQSHTRLFIFRRHVRVARHKYIKCYCGAESKKFLITHGIAAVHSQF
jgi:hypothetical protein